MSVQPELRSLDIDIPAQPGALVKLSLLLAEDEMNLQAAAALIETDMALAAAVLKAVNSSLYGLKGRVQTVQQAITYLGMREVAAITFEMGLRAAFPPAEELEPLWRRAARRGRLMGRVAARLGLDASSYDRNYYGPAFKLLDDPGACDRIGPTAGPLIQRLIGMGGDTEPLNQSQ